MVTQRVNIIGVAFLAILLTTNLNKATSLKCYVCKSDESGVCWTSPEDIKLEECESGSTEISSTTLSSSTTTLATSTSTGTNTPSNTQATSSSTSASTSSGTQATSPPTSASTPSITQATSSSTSASTLSSTQATSSSTSASTLSSTQATPASTSASIPSSTQATSPSTSTNTASITVAAFAESAPFFFKGAEHLRRRREIQYRADETGHQCVKLIYKEEEKEVVERKCILKTSGVPCDQEKTQHTDVSVCEICDNEDGCNSSSNINWGLISMLLPLTVVFYMA